nr:MAG: putative 36 kDa protein [Tomato fruit blotch virus]
MDIPALLACVFMLVGNHDDIRSAKEKYCPFPTTDVELFTSPIYSNRYLILPQLAIPPEYPHCVGDTCHVYSPFCMSVFSSFVHPSRDHNLSVLHSHCGKPLLVSSRYAHPNSWLPYPARHPLAFDAQPVEIVRGSLCTWVTRPSPHTSAPRTFLDSCDTNPLVVRVVDEASWFSFSSLLHSLLSIFRNLLSGVFSSFLRGLISHLFSWCLVVLDFTSYLIVELRVLDLVLLVLCSLVLTDRIIPIAIVSFVCFSLHLHFN